ncbi:MAG TPA: hypothetical protein VGO40_12160 [Longimicrobium sp.]|jgi:hypothetical protein|nr:hypothetical protein [Longimicrobium sp.]
MQVLELVSRDVTAVAGAERARARAEVEARLSANHGIPVLGPEFNPRLQAELQSAITKARNERLARELNLRIGPLLEPYGIELMGRSIDLPPATLLQMKNALAAPVAQQAVQQWTDHLVRDAIAAGGESLDPVVRERLALYVAQGHVLPEAGAAVQVAQAVLGSGFASVSNAPSIVAREAEHALDRQLAQHRAELLALADEIRTAPGKLQEVQNRTEQQLQDLRAGVEARVSHAIEQFVDGVAVIQQKQTELAGRIEAISEKIRQNEIDIRGIAAQLATGAATDALIRQLSPRHAELIERNRVYLDVLLAFTSGQSQFGKELAALNQGLLNHALGPEERAELRADLELGQTMETVNKALLAGRAISGVLQETGLLKGQDAQNVGTALEVLGSAAGIYMSIQTGNPMGAITGVMNLVRLGRGSSPGPSPEMQMLRRIDAKLDRLSEQVGIVDRKLTYLIEFTQKAYEQLSTDLANQHAIVLKNFARLNWKLDTITDIAVVLLQGDLGRCQNRRNNGPFPETFLQYRNRFDADANFYLRDCLEALAKIGSVPESFGAVYYATASDAVSGPAKAQLEYETESIFGPARELFCRYFGLDGSEAERSLPGEQAIKQCQAPVGRPVAQTLLIATNELVVPSRTQGGRTEVRDAVRRHQDEVQIDPVRVTDKMLSPLAVDSISSALVDLLPYFEIGSGSNIRPYASARAYLALDETVRQGRRDNSVRLLNSALRFANYALAQQVMISGAPMLERMYGTLHIVGSNEREKALVVQILRLNPVAAHNFAVHELQRAFNVSPSGTPAACAGLANEACHVRFQELYATVTSAEATEAVKAVALDALNAAGAHSGLRFTRDGRTLWTTHPLWAFQGQETKILVPSPDWLTRNEIAYPEAVYQLLAVKGRIMDAMVSAYVPANLGVAPGNSNSLQMDHYRWALLQ